jgi:ABC-type transport system substrate-binding protein
MRIRSSRLVEGTIVLSLVIAGLSCSSHSSAKSASPALGSTTSHLVPDPNGTLNIAFSSSALADPHTYSGGSFGWDRFTLVYDRLLQLTANNQVAPMLATSWKWNPNLTELTLSLRKGVMFQDGSPFNADVAVKNLQAGTTPTSNGALPLKLMTNVVAVDPYTIRLTFSSPDPDAIFALVGYPGMEVSLNGLAHPSELTQTPMGSGPYKLAGETAPLAFTFARWDGYWDKSHVYPARIQIENIAGETAQLNSVRTSGTSSMAYITSLTYPNAAADKSLQLVKYPSFTSVNIYMNNKVAPFDNLQVRQAVALALNRDTFNTSQQGLCPPIDQAFEPNMDGYVSSLKPTTNVAEATNLIQSAGATGAKVKLVTVNVAMYATFAQLIQAQLDAIGLKVSLSLEPAGATYRILYSQGGFGMLLATPAISAPDPSQILDTYVAGSGNPGTKDPALLAKISQAETLSIGSSQRTAAMQEINKDLTTNYLYWTSICAEYNIFVANSNVIGLGSISNAAISADPTIASLQVGK